MSDGHLYGVDLPFGYYGDGKSHGWHPSIVLRDVLLRFALLGPAKAIVYLNSMFETIGCLAGAAL